MVVERLDKLTLEIFSNLGDSMILYTVISLGSLFHCVSLILLHCLRFPMAFDVLFHKTKSKYVLRDCFQITLGSGGTEQATKSKWQNPRFTNGKLHLGGIEQVLQNSESGLRFELLGLCSLVLSNCPSS